MKKKLAVLSILTLSSILLLSGCKKKEIVLSVENGDKVTISYDSFLQDGEIIDDDVTKSITIGQEESFKIFDTELLGLKVGDEKSFVTSNPDEGYGIYHNDLKIQNISSTVINTIGAELKVGEEVNLGKLKGIIIDTTPTTTTIDFNDRQTRENVEFHVTVLDIERIQNQK